MGNGGTNAGSHESPGDGGREGPLAETCMVHCGGYTRYVRARKWVRTMRHLHDAPSLRAAICRVIKRGRSAPHLAVRRRARQRPDRGASPRGRAAPARIALLRSIPSEKLPGSLRRITDGVCGAARKTYP